jgi:hypothetical protein
MTTFGSNQVWFIFKRNQILKLFFFRPGPLVRDPFSARPHTQHLSTASRAHPGPAHLLALSPLCLDKRAARLRRARVPDPLPPAHSRRPDPPPYLLTSQPRRSSDRANVQAFIPTPITAEESPGRQRTSLLLHSNQLQKQNRASLPPHLIIGAALDPPNLAMSPPSLFSTVSTALTVSLRLNPTPPILPPSARCRNNIDLRRPTHEPPSQTSVIVPAASLPLVSTRHSGEPPPVNPCLTNPPPPVHSVLSPPAKVHLIAGSIASNHATTTAQRAETPPGACRTLLCGVGRPGHLGLG